MGTNGVRLVSEMTWGKAAISMVSLTSLHISKSENQQGDDHDAESEELMALSHITNCICVYHKMDDDDTDDDDDDGDDGDDDDNDDDDDVDDDEDRCR